MHQFPSARQTAHAQTQSECSLSGTCAVTARIPDIPDRDCPSPRFVDDDDAVLQVDTFARPSDEVKRSELTLALCSVLGTIPAFTDFADYRGSSSRASLRQRRAFASPDSYIVFCSLPPRFFISRHCTLICCLIGIIGVRDPSRLLSLGVCKECDRIS